jgi:TatD DNase family protein
LLQIFDSHAHYDDRQFDPDREELLASMREAGVVGILNCGSDWRASLATFDLCRRLDFVYGAVGIHPGNADEWCEEVRLQLLDMLDHPKVVAVGEIGLDYYWEDNPPREVQRTVLRSQLTLALERGLPVVIHDREAHGDTMEFLREFAPKGLRGVLHSFSGSAEMAREAVRLGFYLGISGVVTYKNARKLVEVVQAVPLERLLVETDAPYLAPVPYRGKRNQSAYLEHILARLAELKGISAEEASRVTIANTRALLGIQ